MRKKILEKLKSKGYRLVFTSSNQDVELSAFSIWKGKGNRSIPLTELEEEEVDDILAEFGGPSQDTAFLSNLSNTLMVH